MDLWLQGALVGFSIAAPVGPIGALCIRRSLADGALAGFAVGAGAAVADACYGAIAGFGLSAVSAWLVSLQDPLGIGGGLLLLWYGVRAWRAPVAAEATVSAGSLGAAFAGTFLLTMTNPATVLSFVAVYAGLGLAAHLDARGAALFVLGVLLGSAAWWAILASVAGRLRRRVTPQGMRLVNRASGAFVLLFGAAILALALLRVLRGW